MNGFELMDPKMDCKVNAESYFSPQKAIKDGSIKEAYTDGEILAILNKYLIQEARWLKGNSTISTIYSFQLLADRKLYENQEIINAYLQYLLFLEYETVELVRTSGSVREDEYSFPHLHEPNFTIDSLFDLLELLNSVADKVYDENDNIKSGIAQHLRLRANIIKSFMLLVYGSYILKSPAELIANEESEIAESIAKNKKKGKKNKKKKKQAGKEIDPFEESIKSIKAAIDILLPAIKGLWMVPSEDDRRVADSLFDSTIMKTVNMVISLSNNKLDMTYEVAFDIILTM